MSARQMALEALRNLTDKANVAAFPFTRGDVTKADEAIADLEAELAQVVAPVDCQFQGKDGRWNSFLNEQHKADTIADGTWPIRTLYAAPQAVNAELLELLEALQADAVTYLSDNDCGADWFVNRMLWHLDGPQQRAAQAALEAEIAHPVAPGTKQLTVQLHDEQKWTVAEQQQFAEFLKRFPNESSQGIMSLGDAWKHGKACAAPQQAAAPDMFWNHDDAERLYQGIGEFLNDEICNGALEVGDIRVVQQAIRLPNITIRITSISDEECEADYEIVSAAPGGAA